MMRDGWPDVDVGAAGRPSACYCCGVPNALAFLSLAAWPLVCLAAFARFKPTTALLISFMGAMLFLPEKTEIKVPFQPLGKQEVAAIGALLGVLLVGTARRKLVASNDTGKFIKLGWCP